TLRSPCRTVRSSSVRTSTCGASATNRASRTGRRKSEAVLTVANTILSVLAHPDDAEFLCAGTLARLAREHRWSVHIATMTAGDCGSTQLTPRAISELRRAEAGQAAALLSAAYHCLEQRDLLIFYNEP